LESDSQCQQQLLALHPDTSVCSTHHKDHLQWPVWDYSVYNSYPRSLPLVSTPDQRNLPAYFDTTHDSLSAFNNADLYYLPGHDWQNVDFDDSFYMEDDSLDSTPSGKDVPCDLVEEIGVSITFPEAFFMNPFAVTLPGDLPCPNPISMEQPDPVKSPSSPAWTIYHAPPIQSGRVEKPRPKSTTSSTSSRISSPLHIVEHKAPPSAGETAKKSNTDKPAKYGSQIHFVDMADKKGAQRIRNTMNSRKHRQNKLDKIRELESKLAALEEEKSTWLSKGKESSSKK